MQRTFESRQLCFFVRGKKAVRAIHFRFGSIQLKVRFQQVVDLFPASLQCIIDAKPYYCVKQAKTRRLVPLQVWSESRAIVLG